MASGRPTVLRQLALLFRGGTTTGLTDLQLLERFTSERAHSAKSTELAEAAFGTLVDRHGPMVWGICRRVLADTHEAEDAFQATFLVLVRKGSSVRGDGSLGGWLYRVAHRVAARAKGRRRDALPVDVEPAAIADPERGPACLAEGRDLREVLGAELDRLPLAYRGPVELCDVQGMTYLEAAERLGCPPATVKSRLARGRRRLRERLVRRGLAPAAVAALGVPVVQAGVPREIAHALVRAAMCPARESVPIAVAMLTEEIVTMLTWEKPRVVTTTVLVVAALTAAAWAQQGRKDVAKSAEPRPADTSSQPPDGKGGSRLDHLGNVAGIDFHGVVCVTVSPDGRFLYVAAYNAAAISTFARDAETGQLRHIATLIDPAAFDGVLSIRISPDGRKAAATSFRTAMVTLFDRDPRTGALTRRESHEGRGQAGFGFLTDAMFSPDSRFLYAISNGALIAFGVADGHLKLIQVNEDAAFSGCRALALSPDGRAIYVAASTANTLTVAARDPETGETSVKQALTNGQDNVDGLGGVFGVALSPDGRFVYTTSGRFQGDDAVSVFRRGDDQTLSFIQAIRDGRDGLTDYRGGNDIVVSPDGRNVFACASRSSALANFRRDPSTGKLSVLEVLVEDPAADRRLDLVSGVALSPDGKFLYAASELSTAVTIFQVTRTPSNREDARRIEHLKDIADEIGARATQSHAALEKLLASGGVSGDDARAELARKVRDTRESLSRSEILLQLVREKLRELQTNRDQRDPDPARP